MNTTELKALAEKATPGPWKNVDGIVLVHWDTHPYATWLANFSVGGESMEKKLANSAFCAAANPAAILELIAKLEDAQGEIRALRATEAGLREKAERWDFLASRMLAADFDYGEEGVQALVFEMPDGFRASANAADTIDRARALLEKKG